MEIDELKNTTKNIKAPDMGTLPFKAPVRSVNGLAEELKREDAKERKRLRRFIFLFGLATVLLSLSFLRPGIGAGYRIGLGLLVGTYAAIVAVSAAKYFRINAIDYAEPTLVFLKKAEKRYRFIAPWEIYYMAPFLGILCAAGWFLLFENRYFVKLKHSPFAAVIYVLAYLAVCVFGFAMTKKDWRKQKGPVHAKVKLALEEFLKDENGA
jgi:hypothetical protein